VANDLRLRAVAIVELTETLYVRTCVCIRHLVTYLGSRQSPVLELAEVMLHLKPFTHDEPFGLPMITVVSRTSRGHC